MKFNSKALRAVKASAVSFTIGAAMPLVAFAQLNIPKGGPQEVADIQKGILCQALDWLFTLAIIMGVLFLLVAAFRYVSSGGSAEEVKKVHEAVKYALVGMAVALLAGGAPYIISSFVGTGFLKDYCTISAPDLSRRT